MWWSHAGSHEEHHILMSRLSVVHHLLLKEFQMILVVSVDLQQPYGYLPMPPALVNSAPATLSGSKITFSKLTHVGANVRMLNLHLSYELSKVQLLKGDVPLLKVDAGLRAFAGDGSLPHVALRAGQVVQIVAIQLPV